MDWWSEVKAQFRKAASRTLLPAVWLPGVLVGGGLGMALMLVSFSLISRAGDLGRVADSGGAVALVFLSLLAFPAVQSGLWAVSKAVVAEGEAEWSDFWSGAGTYYWRLAGLFLLIAVAAMILGPSLARTVSSRLYPGGSLDGAATPFVLLYIVSRYFAATVVPAMVWDQLGVFAAVGRGFSFAWFNVPALAPAVAVDLVGNWIFQKIDLTSPAVASAQTLQLDAGVVVLYGVSVLVTSFVSCFFRLLYLGIYESRQSSEVIPPVPPPGSPVGPSAEWDSMPPAEKPVEPSEPPGPPEPGYCS